ncbi:MAG: InlB B-repeat-containing protein [Clostridiales bacterium]|nr:InlB B-repeat-containing protein [Clostridiales bacterium]
MKKSKFLAAALAATMFSTAACGLVACDKDAVEGAIQQQNPTGSTYTVSFNAGTGTLNGAATLKTNKEGIVQGTIPTATPASTDYTFLGWSLTSGATTDAAKINFTTQKFTKDTPVYAIYKSNGINNNDGEYTITFDYGDGTGSTPSAQTVNKKLASLPNATPNDSDYTFDGWYTSPNGGGTAVTTSYEFSSSTTIYAYYTSNNVVVGVNYAMVGAQKYELTEAYVDGADQGFTATIDLNEGDTISFYVNEELVEAWASFAKWNGMQKETQKTSVFTAARQGTFEFELAYYPASDLGDATWSLAADDGQAPDLGDRVPVEDGNCYMVGKFGDAESWDDGLMCEEISSDDSNVVKQFTFTYTLSVGDTIKFRYDGRWIGNIEGNCPVLSGQMSQDGEGNIVVNSAGTYTFYIKTYKDGGQSIWVSA